MHSEDRRQRQDVARQDVMMKYNDRIILLGNKLVTFIQLTVLQMSAKTKTPIVGCYTRLYYTILSCMSPPTPVQIVYLILDHVCHKYCNLIG